MINIGTITQSLIDEIKTVTEYNNQVGLMVGGTEFDRFNRDLPPPSAWVVYVGDALVEDSDLYSCTQQIRLLFDVRIITDKTSEADIIAEQLPLLHETVEAVLGKEPIPGSNWSYDGQRLINIEGRMVWNQQYSILTVLG